MNIWRKRCKRNLSF